MADDPINAGEIEWLNFRFQQLEEEELFCHQGGTKAHPVNRCEEAKGARSLEQVETSHSVHGKV